MLGRAEVGRWTLPTPTPGGRLLQVLGPQGPHDRCPPALRGPSAGTHELQVKVSSAVLRTVTQAEASGHTPPTRVHTCFQVGDSSIRPQPMSFLPFPKGQKGLHPQGKACTLGSEPICCRMSIKYCGVKMHSQPASVSPRTLFTGHGENPREEDGVPPRSHQPLQGRRQQHPADIPTCLPLDQMPGSRRNRLYWDSGYAPRARRAWDRVTARKPQVTRICAKPPGGLCSLCPGGLGWLCSGALPPPIIPVTVCLGH